MTMLLIFAALFVVFVVCFVCLAAGSRADDIIEDYTPRRIKSVPLNEMQEIEEELKN